MAAALQKLRAIFNAQEQGSKEEKMAARNELRQIEDADKKLKKELNERFEKLETLTDMQPKSIDNKIKELEKILAINNFILELITE